MSLRKDKLLISLAITFAMVVALIVVAVQHPITAGILFLCLVVCRAVWVGRRHGFRSGVGMFLKEILFGW